MKKLFTLLVFTFALVLGTQDAQAQNANAVHENPEAEAKAKVHALDQQLDLNGEQEVMLFRAYVTQDYNYNKYLKNLDQNSAEYKKKKAEYDKNLDDSAKRTLTPEQYAKYKKIETKK